MCKMLILLSGKTARLRRTLTVNINLRSPNV
uniref:Uncharacterized protein n=1 Tax=Anguilla anguilla TaxID=7936 RepID=A0A0E9TUT2_ANGAN